MTTRVHDALRLWLFVPVLLYSPWLCAQDNADEPRPPPPQTVPAPGAPSSPAARAPRGAPAPARPAANADQTPTTTNGGGCKPTKDQVCMSFHGSDIQSVVKVISQITGRNFLLDPRVKGQITIISSK